MFYVYTVNGPLFAGSMDQLLLKTRKDAVNRTEAPNHITAEHRQNPDAAHQYKSAHRAISEYKNNTSEKNAEREAVYCANQIMNAPVVTLGITATIQQAFEVFNQYSFHLFPVVNQYGQLCCVLSRLEFYEVLLNTKPAIQPHRLISEVFDFSERQIICAETTTDIRQIARVLVEQCLDAMPIVSGDDSSEFHPRTAKLSNLEQPATGLRLNVVGIVSRTDILRCATMNPPLSLWC